MKKQVITIVIPLLAVIVAVTGCNSSANSFPAPKKRIEAAMENIDDLAIPNETAKFATIHTNIPLNDETILLMIEPKAFEGAFDNQLSKFESVVRRVLQMRESYAQYHEDFARLDAEKAAFEKKKAAFENERAAFEEEKAEFERKKREFETAANI